MKNVKTKIKGLTLFAALVGFQMVASQSAVAVIDDYGATVILKCYDGAKPMSMRLWWDGYNGRGTLVSLEGFVPGRDWQIHGEFLKSGSNVIQFFGSNGPQLALENEIEIQAHLQVGRLGHFAQGAYSIQKGGKPFVENAAIECQIIK